MAAVADYDNALVSLTGDVANSYISIRTLEKRLAIARQNVVVQKKSLQIATARWQGGTTSKRDVEQAQTVLDGTEASIPTLEAQSRQTQNALSVLMGLPPSDLKDVLGSKSEIPAPPLQVAVGIPADLLRRRPDIQSAEWRAAAQCAQIGVAKANLYPAFSLSGTFGLQAADVPPFVLSNMFDWRSRTGTMGPSFQWNLFNYGQITNQVRFQDARFQELIIAYQQTVLQAQQEVENALIGFLKAQQRAQKLVGATGAAQRSVDLATLQYRQGITDFTTVLTAEQNLLTYQDSLASYPGRYLQQPGGDVPGHGRRLAVARGPGFRAGRRERGHGQTQQLGQAAHPGGPAAAARNNPNPISGCRNGNERQFNGIQTYESSSKEALNQRNSRPWLRERQAHPAPPRLRASAPGGGVISPGAGLR